MASLKMMLWLNFWATALTTLTVSLITSGPIPSPGNRAIFISIRIFVFLFVFCFFELVNNIQHFFGCLHGCNRLITVKALGFKYLTIIPSNDTFDKSIGFSTWRDTHMEIG